MANSVFSKLYKSCILGQPKKTKIIHGINVQQISIISNSEKYILKKLLSLTLIRKHRTNNNKAIRINKLQSWKKFKNSL